MRAATFSESEHRLPGVFSSTLGKSDLLLHRHSWIWAVLPPHCRRIVCVGDPELARFLRGLGFDVLENGAADPGRDGALVAPVGGGDPAPPRPVPRVVRALQLSASPITAVAAELAARRVARTLRRSGLLVSRLRTGDRARVRYGLGPGGWIKRRRLPAGSILTGMVGERPPSVSEVATDRSAQALGLPLRWRAGNVFQSGKLAVELTDSEGAAYYLWVAAGIPGEELQRSREAVRAISRADPPQVVRDRLIEPITDGYLGPAHYVLEPRASGTSPSWMTSRLWDECLEFLTALHRLPTRSPELRLQPAGPDLEWAVEFLAKQVDPQQRSALERVHREVRRRLSEVPLGASHGDFWSSNLIVRGGHLRAVVDWEWARTDGLPLLDLMDLIAPLGRRRGGMAPGPRFTRVLWPLAQRGGDQRMRHYCQETGTPADSRTLEGLAAAYWLLRSARIGWLNSHCLRDRGWLDDNVFAPLAQLSEMT